MFGTTKKTLKPFLLISCFIVAIFVMFVGSIPQLRQIIPALALTATPGPVNLPDLQVWGIGSVRLGGSCENRWGTTVTVRNNTAVAINTPFIVRLNNTQSATVNALAGNTSTTVQFNNGFAPSNFATADATNVIVESNEVNNSLTLTMAPTPTGTMGPTCTPGTPTPTRTNTPPGLTDLSVVSMSSGSVAPSCQGQIVTNVTVRNNGSLNVNNPFVVRLNNTQDRTVNSLAAGQSTTVQFTGIISPSTATVDANNTLPEYNENNNSMTSALAVPTPAATCTPPAVTNTPTIFDLAVTNIAGGTLGPICNNQYVTNVTIRNLGGNGSSPYWVILNNVTSPQQPSLPSGASTVVQFAGIMSPSTARVTLGTAGSDVNTSNDSLTVTLPVPSAVATCTPTGIIITNTPTRTMVSPVTISGRITVNSPDGMGVAGISILHAFGPAPMTLAAITDSTGFYTFTKDTMNHQETNNLAAQPGMGYTFSPVSYQFISQTSGGTFVRDFIAVSSSPTPSTPTNTPTRTQTPTRTNTPGTPTRTPTRTNTPVTPTTPPPTGSLKVQYRAADTNAGDNQFKPHFNIVNTGSSSVAMSELKIRYYFTKDGGGSLVFNCDWAAKGCGNLSGAFVAISPAKTNADYYLEVSFSAGAGSIAAGQSSGEIQTRNHKSDWTNFNESNDYSFDPTKTVYADWTRVVLLRNGTVVWGTAP